MGIKLKTMLNNRIIKAMVIAAIAAIFLEVTVMNMSFYRTLGLTETDIVNDVGTDETGEYISEAVTVNTDVKNVQIELDTVNCKYATATVYLTDEGNAYEYPLPSVRITPLLSSTGLFNIYPYGEVNTLRVAVNAPEGGQAIVRNISCNVNRPFDIKPLRVILFFALFSIFCYVWCGGQEKSYSGSPKLYQWIIILAAMLFLVITGIWLTKSNELIVASPWPHHKQYQELAHNLSEGTVILKDKAVDPRLAEKENPYDTISLMAEEIPFNMDYAYYNGNYYVYFGIVPELMFYYPHYKLTGEDMTNLDVMQILWIMLVAGVFLSINQLIKRMSRDTEVRVSFFTYIFISVAVCLFSNHVYMVSRADIYNIPVMSATVFTYLGIGLWLLSRNTENRVISNCVMAAGSLFMAMVAGARPQLLLYSAVCIPVFLISGKKKKPDVPAILSFILPYMIVATVVCWYNYARFGNILDFGATYSLTTNDMNHRGFNLDRLARGLYSFFLQPANMVHDFPYIVSSAVRSNYMGRNLSEYIYGGVFVTNIMSLILFAPLINKDFRKKIPLWIKKLCVILCLSSFIISIFDVNAAGILYRYSCDMTPGIIIAAVALWLFMIGTAGGKKEIVMRLLTISLFAGLCYSFLVFMGPAAAPSLQDDSIYTYELIRSYFRI